MLDEIKTIKSDTPQLRSFGYVMACALVVLTTYLFFKKHPAPCPWLLGVAGFFLIAGLFLPKILWPLHKAWMTLAIAMGFVMSRIILSLLFFGVFTTLGLIARLFGKHFLAIKIDPSASTYWNDRSQTPLDPKHCEKQF